MNDAPAQKVLLSHVNRDATNVRRLEAVDRLRILAMLAIDVALDAALDKPNQPGYYTYVNRDTVREIRSVLQSAGIDWKAQHKQIRSK
jgi:hypothetical protein